LEKKKNLEWTMGQGLKNKIKLGPMNPPSGGVSKPSGKWWSSYPGTIMGWVVGSR